MKQGLSLFLALFCLSLVNSLSPNAVLAQVTPDGTTSTTVDADGNNVEINDGDRAGDNLFHSFDDFSVPKGGEAFFNNAADIINIFSRVTGGNISDIDGLIRANGSANLFLVNPAGILFGENASLDIGGSFYGTSADSILFEDGGFSATDLENPPLLTINAPIGLSLRDDPGDIAVEGANLEVNSGQSLTLVGGNLRLQDGARLLGLGGRVQLGGVSSSGIVNFDDNLNLDFPENIALADVTLSNDAIVNVTSSNGGSIEVTANNLDLNQNSALNAGIGQNTGSPDAQAGDIVVTASGNINLDNSSSIFNQVSNNGQGNSGNVAITANSLTLNNGSFIGGQTSGTGDSGDFILNVADNIEISGASSLRSIVETNAVGNSGNIAIDTGVLRVSGENSLIFANTRGTGNAGSIAINATESVTFTDNSDLLSQVQTNATGNSGNITITTPILEVINGSSIVNSTEGIGNAGNLSIPSSESIVLDNGKFQSNVRQTGVGNAGNIDINSGFLLLENDSQFIANSLGQGNAGNIIINATEDVTLNTGSDILSNVSRGMGNAGDILINSGRLVLEDRSFIISNTGDLNQDLENIGDAGNISINAELISLDDFSLITSNTLSLATGRSGNIDLTANDLIVGNGSVINSLTQNNFDGGQININASNVELTNGGKIVTGTESIGNAGNIIVNLSGDLNIDGTNPPVQAQADKFPEAILQELELETGLFANTIDTSSGNGGSIQIIALTRDIIINNGSISVDSQGLGNGGNLSIESRSLTLNNQSQLIGETASSSQNQQLSNITLQISNNLFLRNNSQISAQSFNNANGGNININAGFVVAFPAEGDGNDILARAAAGGTGGQINIETQQVFGLAERRSFANNETNDIDASSDFGLNGDVSINTPDVNSLQRTTALPNSVIEPQQTIEDVCVASPNNGKPNGLTIKGKGGTLPSPNAAFSADVLTIGGRIVSDRSPSIFKKGEDNSTSPQINPEFAEIKPIRTSRGDIYPARGIIKTKDGQTILTAYPTDNVATRTPTPKKNCNYSNPSNNVP
jgi:filamentous hemagglutinin family protein